MLSHLEFRLHAGDGLSVRQGLHEQLDVRVQRSGGHLRTARHDGLHERVVDEHVLVLGLDLTILLQN